MKSKRPILITGLHRSGTTWVGLMLSLARELAYIHEPFNRNSTRKGISPLPLNFDYQYITHANETDIREIYSKILHFNYFASNELPFVKGVKDLTRMARDMAKLKYCRFRKMTPLIKDPIAFFSTEWLAEAFDMRVIILVRHPAAFASSVMLKGWEFDFNNLLRQDLLMQDILYPFESVLKNFVENKKPIIEQTILLWNIFAFVTERFRKEHTDWMFYRHEDISKNPTEEFSKIYDKLDLLYSAGIRKKINRTSGIGNPSEQLGNSTHVLKKEFKRDSRKNIDNWKRRLNLEEIEKIYDGTRLYFPTWYDETDWN